MNHRCRTSLSVFALIISPAVAVCGVAAAEAETGEPQKISFDDLKFEHKTDQPFKRSMLPKKIEALDGQRVTIRGWINPASTFKPKGITTFTLLRDNTTFFQDFPFDEIISIDMSSGRKMDFTTRPITVDGIFSIRELKVEGKLVAVYHIEATTAK